MKSISIRKASLEEVLCVHRQIPEFIEEVSEDFYRKRLTDKICLCLVAESEDGLLGFKVGHETKNPEQFYSWMGGVLPKFRNQGVAEALADYQESWAISNGYKSIFFKTRNRFPSMICFGLKRGFKIVQVIYKGEEEDYRIVMRKNINS